MNDASQAGVDSTRPKSDKRGRVGTKILIGIGIAVAIFVGLIALLFKSPEAMVEFEAGKINAQSGTMLDEITRLDGAEASGSTLLVRHTILDSALEFISQKAGEDLPADFTLHDFASLSSEAMLAGACTQRSDLPNGEEGIVIIFEYRDERGEVLLHAQADRTTCEGTT